MSAEENKVLVRRLFVEVFDQGNLSVADDLFAPDYVLHDPTAYEAVVGPEGYKQFQAMYLTAFPDHRLTIEEQFATGDRVVTRWQSRGSQRGDLPGIRATGREVIVTGITISRLRDGKIVEDEQEWDALGMMRQLGVFRTVGHPGD